jgi:hypothetical protein
LLTALFIKILLALKTRLLLQGADIFSTPLQGNDSVIYFLRFSHLGKREPPVETFSPFFIRAAQSIQSTKKKYRFARLLQKLTHGTMKDLSDCRLTNRLEEQGLDGDTLRPAVLRKIMHNTGMAGSYYVKRIPE